MTDNGWITRVLKSRFRLPWDSHRAPLLLSPSAFHTPASPVITAALEQEISSLLDKQAIEEVSHLPSPYFYGRIFVVPKASPGFPRVAPTPLSVLNLYLRRTHFRMETTLSIRDAIQQGDWAASLDMTEAFFHFPIHPKDRKRLRFVWEGRSFQFRALPFGLSLSPWVFTRSTRELALHLCTRGIRLQTYLDDWQILQTTAISAVSTFRKFSVCLPA